MAATSRTKKNKPSPGAAPGPVQSFGFVRKIAPGINLDLTIDGENELGREVINLINRVKTAADRAQQIVHEVRKRQSQFRVHKGGVL